MQIPIREKALRFWLIGALLVGSWLGMQLIHELGHVAHCKLSGGTILQVVLHPLEVSRTEFTSNPAPQFTAWGGVSWGTLCPLLFLGALVTSGFRQAHIARFFAGFCLVANGIYFFVGTVELAADPGDLVRFGANRYIVGLVGVLLFAAGLRLWHGLARSFGFGDESYRTPLIAAVAVTSIDIVLIAVGLFLASC